MPNNIGLATQDEVHRAIETAQLAARTTGAKVTADQAFQQLKTLSNPIPDRKKSSGKQQIN